MLELGVIEETESSWSLRLLWCEKVKRIDSRKLKALTIKDAYLLPHIKGLFNRLGDTHYIQHRLEGCLLASSIGYRQPYKDGFHHPMLATVSLHRHAFRAL